MAQRTIKAALVLLLGLTAGSTLRAEELSPAQAEDVRQGVQATLDAYRELSSAGECYAAHRLDADEPHCLSVTSGTVVSRSVDEIRKYFTELPAGTRIDTTYQDTQVMPVTPGVAEVVTSFQTRLVDP